MHDCSAPEDIFSVLTTVWPPLPFLAILTLVAAGIFWVIEASMRFGFGGVPDGLFGMIGLLLAGIATISWGNNWPDGCVGTVHVVGWLQIGISIVVTAALLLFWRARRHDGGTLIRGYGGPTHPQPYDPQ